MKRSTPLKRTPLKRSRKPLKRTAIKKRRTVTTADRQNPFSTYWRERCDTIWSMIIRHRAGYRCQKCGRKAKKLDTHHLIPRGRYMTRHELSNGLALDAGCHTFNNDSAHHDRTGFTNWFKEALPEQYAWVVKHGNDEGRPCYKEIYDNLMNIAMEEGAC